MDLERSLIQRYRLVFFFALAFLFTWANWLPRALADRGWLEIQVPEFVGLIAGYGPALAALIVAGLTRGKDGLRELFARLARYRVGLKWYLAALLIPMALQLSSLGLNLLIRGEPFRLTRPEQLLFGPGGPPLWVQALILVVIFILGFDGLGEEIGWRGYALPRLLEKRSPLVSSLILGFFWALWHVPYIFSAGSALADRPLPLFFMNLMGLSVVYTWITTHTRGSTLLAILFHASGNTTGTLLAAMTPAAGDPQGYLIGTVLNWLVAIFLVITQREAKEGGFAGEVSVG